MQAITSATNRSLAESPEEGRLQQTQPIVTRKKDQYIDYKGSNLVDKKLFVNIDQYSASGHNFQTKKCLPS